MFATRVIAPAAVCIALAAGCQDGPAPDADQGASEQEEVGQATAASPGTLPLKEIMGALEEDLIDVGHGLWVDDASLVSAAATRIAEHPTVLPAQMVTIQSVLGDEFASFAQMDRQVHDGAVALAAAAEAGEPISDLFEGYVRIQNGCLACHIAFRPRVSEALAPESP